MTGTQHVYTTSPSEPLSQTIVYGIADAKGIDPMDLDECLYDCIDPEALDELFDSSNGSLVGTFSFSMSGCRVEVERGQKVIVTERQDEQTRVGVTA
ncbi:HalOD1 output domain-containing protein [Haloarcula sp. JP-L23]|uniref:HalOD1 output domain-containing protein n=1 Tax=Haloarcula sp. JP-L23 TaxID=2716717 RepID=UPI00140EA381|nr:hypothetical protein G9465_06875 [Haloarcula sp. JP-L23]